MKFQQIVCLLVATVVSGTDALSQPSVVVAGRRAFLTKAATTAAVAATATAASMTVAANPAFAAEKYSLELDESYKKEEPEKKSGNGGGIVGGALAGGFLLSLPFFAPNLARIAGYKNAKIKKP